MASPVDIASIFKRKGQTPTPETQAPSQGVVYHQIILCS